MIYLTVDGMFSGTGIRDSIEGGYLKLNELAISPEMKAKISAWVSRYAEAHFIEYEDKSQVSILDNEGIAICKALRKELPDAKVEYYSNAEMKKINVL